MSGISRNLLFSIALIGLCSCVQTPPKPVSIEERNTFVHVGALYEPQLRVADPRSAS